MLSLRAATNPAGRNRPGWRSSSLTLVGWVTSRRGQLLFSLHDDDTPSLPPHPFREKGGPLSRQQPLVAGEFLPLTPLGWRITSCQVPPLLCPFGFTPVVLSLPPGVLGRGASCWVHPPQLPTWIYLTDIIRSPTSPPTAPPPRRRSYLCRRTTADRGTDNIG